MITYTVRRERGRNPWNWKPDPYRRGKIAGVVIHSTRSGQPGLDYDDGPGTENWGMNPNNGSAAQGWGTYWDLLIYRNGTRVISTDWDTEFASWTAGYGAPGTGTWPLGIPYIQIEVSQARIDQPFSPESIDSLAQAVAEAAQKYDFPIRRLPFIPQTGTPERGIGTHEDSANGKHYGKTDPGPLFPWVTFLGLANDYLKGGNSVTRSEYEALLARVENLELAVFAGGEERSGDALLPRAERLSKARYRIQNAGVLGVDPDTGKPARSVRDIAASAETAAKAAGAMHWHDMQIGAVRTGPPIAGETE